jgi:isopentenyl-diphosphate delta-isomerase
MRQKMQPEHVILLDSLRSPCGIQDKTIAHHQLTPLHLAFSCWIFNSKGQLLITRRALSKKAWPGVWSNSVCGHPQQHEPFEAAVQRRCSYEVNIDVEDIILIDNAFSYCETDPSGIRENEYCPVYAARATSSMSLRKSEVMDASWVKLPALIAAVNDLPALFSPWMVQQLQPADNVDKLLRYSDIS